MGMGKKREEPLPIAETSHPTPLTFLTLLMAVLLLPAHCIGTKVTVEKSEGRRNTREGRTNE